MDDIKKLVIFVVAIIIFIIVAVIFALNNKKVEVERTEIPGTIYLNIEENYNKYHAELSQIRSSYVNEFELKIKKGEELRLPSMYQSIPFKVSRINDDDSVLIKTNMKFFLKKDYSDGGFEEFTISPGENKTLYFDGMDTDGFVTVRYEK